MEQRKGFIYFFSFLKYVPRKCSYSILSVFLIAYFSNSFNTLPSQVGRLLLLGLQGICHALQEFSWDFFFLFLSLQQNILRFYISTHASKMNVSKGSNNKHNSSVIHSICESNRKQLFHHPQLKAEVKTLIFHFASILLCKFFILSIQMKFYELHFFFFWLTSTFIKKYHCFTSVCGFCVAMVL